MVNNTRKYTAQEIAAGLREKGMPVHVLSELYGTDGTRKPDLPGQGKLFGTPSEPPPYFTSDGSTVPDDERWSQLELVGCRCKSRFCPLCCKGMAIDLKQRMEKEVESWGACLMLTLTLDPKMWEHPKAPPEYRGPEGAYRWVQQKRAVAKLIRRLYKAGHLFSEKWVAVLEWQKNGYAHWHVLVDSSRVPFDNLAAYWGAGKIRPEWVGPYDPTPAPGDKSPPPRFGHVRFSKGGNFRNKLHAVRYVCKYVSKVPAEGFPEWVMHYKGRIRRFSTSRSVRLYPHRPREPRDPAAGCGIERCDDECFCSMCRGSIVFVNMCDSSPEKKPERSIVEKIKRCRLKAAIVRVDKRKAKDGTVTIERRSFVAGLRVLTFAEAMTFTVLGVEGARRVPLAHEEAKAIIDVDASRERAMRNEERRERKIVQRSLEFSTLT